jgi:hypothetical protein
MEHLEQLVIIAERRAKALGKLPFHNMDDADHRAICWGCLFDWWQSK